jgi:F5/8 type C domain-containing protein
MTGPRIAVLREWIRPEHVASPYSETRRARIERLVSAATIRARSGRDDSTRAAAICGASALREAVVLLVRATGLAETGKESDDHAACLQAIFARHQPVDLDRALALGALRATAPLYFDELSTEELCRVREALECAVEWLHSRLDVRTTTHLRGARLGRVGGVALGVIFIAYKVLSALLGPVNVALHKRVAASSLLGLPSGEGLVDGIKDGVIGVQTGPDGHPWVQIDLSLVCKIERIVVYNRGDHNLNDSLPYDLEVSEDGREYKSVEHRVLPFGDGTLGAPPWSAKTSVRARFVRLRAQPYIALSEVEVFGKL